MKTNRWIMTTIVAAGVMLAGSAQAGDLTPPGAPGPTMNTLAELYQKLTNALAEVKATKTEVEANQQKLAELQQRLVAVGTMQQTSGDMVLIPAASYVMGACTNVGQESFLGETPQHAVTVGAFYMDKCEITSNLWHEVQTWATNRGYSFGEYAGVANGPNFPVDATWYDCLAWCNARSQKDGFAVCYTNANGTVYTNGTDHSFAGGCDWNATGYRLPTEAEWEKAARGGLANRRFSWGDANTIQHTRANYLANPGSISYDTSPTTGCHPSSSGGQHTMPVGSFAANGYGLYDMTGNVREWCWDWWNDTYYSISPSTDPKGPDDGTYRVNRGGSGTDEAWILRCAIRTGYYPFSNCGFRCVRGF